MSAKPGQFITPEVCVQVVVREVGGWFRTQARPRRGLFQHQKGHGHRRGFVFQGLESDLGVVDDNVFNFLTACCICARLYVHVNLREYAPYTCTPALMYMFCAPEQYCRYCAIFHTGARNNVVCMHVCACVLARTHLYARESCCQPRAISLMLSEERPWQAKVSSRTSPVPTCTCAVQICALLFQVKPSPSQDQQGNQNVLHTIL